MDGREQQHSRLCGALLLHVFGPDRTIGNEDRYRTLSDHERKVLGPYVGHGMHRLQITRLGEEARAAGVAAMAQACRDLDPPSRDDALPTPAEIAQRLSVIGGHSSAVRLKARLTEEGWRTSRAELGIQRAIDSGEIEFDRDWTIRLPRLQEGS